MSAAPPPFRRRVELRRLDPSTVDGSLEDHFHHFESTVVHDADAVTAIEARAPRAPWSLCPGAGAQLQELVGKPIGVPPQVADVTDHCTHLLDLALTVVRFAGTGLEHRRYEMTVTDWDTDESEATLERDDGRVLRWRSSKGVLTGPEPFTGRSTRAGFARWVAETFDPDEGEMVLHLRRATWLAPSRTLDMDQYDVLRESGLPEGTCYASQPERIDIAARNRGTIKPLD